MSEQKRTEALIGYLSQDALRESGEGRTAAQRRQQMRLSVYARWWLAGAAVVMALSFWLLPEREDLFVQLGRLSGLFVFMLWSLAALLPAIKVYGLAFPDGQNAEPVRQLARFAWVPLALLFVWTTAHFQTNDLAFQLFRESSHLNGGCGMVILVAGTIHASFLFTWIRRGATTSPVQAAAWAAVSTAAFASFIVQFACANENPIHVLLWHFIPLLILTGVAAVSGRRLMRW